MAGFPSPAPSFGIANFVLDHALGETRSTAPILLWQQLNPCCRSFKQLALFALQLYIHAMAHAITMRELQKLSASTIERLPGAVPVQSDGRTVALLVPLRPASDEARARFREALAKAQAERTPAEQDSLDREFGA